MTKFEPIFFKDQLRIINPNGFVGLVTLWSDPDAVLDWFKSLGINLSNISSPIAAVGTLYGNGLPQLLRNLLRNPQIQLLVCCGDDRAGSLNDLTSFFKYGTEPYEGSSPYSLDGKSVDALRIKRSGRIIDGLVTLQDFESKPSIVHLGGFGRVEGEKGSGGGGVGDARSEDRIRTFFAGLSETSTVRSSEGQRSATQKMVPLPKVEFSVLPSNPRAFVIHRKDVFRAWEHLVFILYRFGRVASLKKGDRKELQNVKVVVEEPSDVPDPRLFKYWFKREEITNYQREILSDYKPNDLSYTYGNRLRKYFGADMLEKVIRQLGKDGESRKSYISLWNSYSDLDTDDTPCLASLFFRLFDGRLTLTASYRVHNAIDAWIYNFYGLKSVLDFVANKLNMTPGAITVISHSVSIDMNEMARATIVVNKRRRFEVNLDPNGYFAISVDPRRRDIVVHHYSHDHMLIKEYRAKKAERLQHQLSSDITVSDINHAIYLGRQLSRAENALALGLEFIQG